MGNIAEKIVAGLAAYLPDPRRCEQATDILRFAARYGLLDGIQRAHLFDLAGSEGIGIALSAHDLTSDQRAYSRDGARPEDVRVWLPGCVRIVFLDLDERAHVAWLLNAGDKQEIYHDRPALRL